MSALVVSDAAADLPPRPQKTGTARPRRDHVRGLDGLRAIAVVAVVVYHFQSSALPGGFLGVDLFFVISGYLITRLLVLEYLDHGRIDLVAFYRRRARRLLPALAVLVATACGAALVWRDQLATVRPAVLAAAGYVSNWWLIGAHQSYFVSAGRPSMLQHLWSLAVEEQFYLLWPVLLGLVLAAIPAVRRGPEIAHLRLAARLQRVHRLAVAATVLGCASAALLWWLAVAGDVPYGADGSRLYYGTDTHCLGLLFGAAFGARAAGRAFVASLPARPPAASSRHWLADAVGVCALVGFLRLTGTLNQYEPELFRTGFLVASLLGCAVVASVTRPASVLGTVLEWAPLRWIGVRSYSIYLWHWPVAVVTRPGLDLTTPTWTVQVFRAGLTLALAAASYRWVEQPIRAGGLRYLRDAVAGRPRPSVRAVTITALMVTAVGVLVLDPRPPRSDAQPPSPVRSAAPARSPARAPSGSASSASSVPAPTPSGSAATAPATAPGTAPATGSATAPATAPATAAGAPLGTSSRAAGQVSAFGDSVMLGAGAALSDEIPGVLVDAVEGEQARPMLARVRQLAGAGKLGSVVIIHTGNNGVIDPGDLTATLQALSGVRRVVVLTDRVARDWQEPNNATIAAVVPRFGNAEVIDWHAAANGHPEWFWSDGLHLRPAGSAAYATVIGNAISR